MHVRRCKSRRTRAVDKLRGAGRRRKSKPARTADSLRGKVKRSGPAKTIEGAGMAGRAAGRSGKAIRRVSVAEDLSRPQLGEPHHHAYVVDDISATVSGLVDQLGAGPFFVIENVPLENVRSSFTTPPSATTAAARSS